MKITIATKDLVDAMKKVSSVSATEKNNKLIVLSHVHMKTTDTGIFVTCTNLRQTISVNIHCTVIERGRLCCPAKKLLQIISKTKVDQLEIIKVNSRTTEILVNSRKFSLVSLSPDEYPLITAPDTHKTVSMPTPRLNALLKRTALTMTKTEDSSYSLNGAELSFIEPHKLQVATTDGHQLTVISRLVQVMEGSSDSISNENAKLRAAKDNGRAIVPYRAMVELEKLTRKEICSVFISFAGNYISFTIGNTLLVSSLLAGVFPMWEKVVPDSNSRNVLNLNTKELIAILKSISITANDLPVIDIDLVGGKLSLSITDKLTGTRSDTIQIPENNQSLFTGCSYIYLLKNLKSFKHDTITIEFHDSSMITLHDTTDPDYFFLLMGCARKTED